MAPLWKVHSELFRRGSHKFSKNMDSREEAILKTLLYSDFFDDPVVSPDPAALSFNHSAATEQRCGSHTHTRTHSASWRTPFHLHSSCQRLTAHTDPGSRDWVHY